MESEIREKYIGIIKSNHILKADASDIFDVITNDEELANMMDQTGVHLADSTIFPRVKGKAIAKIVKMENGTSYLYWSVCSFDDLINVTGANSEKFNGVRYYVDFRINRDNQISFYGKDIKRAVSVIPEGAELNEIQKYFVDSYINTDHPIGDSVMYTLFIKEPRKDVVVEEGPRQTIHCSRNLNLSPRKIRTEQPES